MASISMQVYNGKKYIKEALESLLSDAFTVFEFTISYNYSTDSTPEICKEYASKNRRTLVVKSALLLTPTKLDIFERI
jgi:glycosyltransferase involved in cell wall biosynthesis